MQCARAHPCYTFDVDDADGDVGGGGVGGGGGIPMILKQCAAGAQKLCACVLW